MALAVEMGDLRWVNLCNGYPVAEVDLHRGTMYRHNDSSMGRVGKDVAVCRVHACFLSVLQDF